MNIERLRDYLLSFNISQEVIDTFLQDKKIFLKFKHIYLVDKGFSGKKVFDTSLIFVQLETLVPSKYLLNFILIHSKNKVLLRSRDVVLKIAYGKQLPRGVDYGIEFEDDKRYILDYFKEVVGVVKVERGNYITEMNIGEYLKEGN